MFDMQLLSESIKDIVVKLMDQLGAGASWIVNHDTPRRVAVKSYIEDIQNSPSLDPQTKAVLIYNAKRDIKRAVNTLSICEKAAGKISPDAKIYQLDPDWASLFEEKASIISTEEMQEIWSMILSQECNQPGSIPKILLQTLEGIGRSEADDFTRLASFCLDLDGELRPLIVNSKINDYYSNHGLGLGTLHKLETLGLINYDPTVFGGIAYKIKDDSTIKYFGQSIHAAEVKKNESKQLSFGNVSLSFVGEVLINIVGPTQIDGFFEEVALPYLRNPENEIESMLDSAAEKSL